MLVILFIFFFQIFFWWVWWGSYFYNFFFKSIWNLRNSIAFVWLTIEEIKYAVTPFYPPSNAMFLAHETYLFSLKWMLSVCLQKLLFIPLFFPHFELLFERVYPFLSCAVLFSFCLTICYVLVSAMSALSGVVIT